MTKPKYLTTEYTSEETLETVTQLLGQLVARKARGDKVDPAEVKQLETLARVAVALRKEEREAAMDETASLADLTPEEKKIAMEHMRKKFGT